MAYEYLPRNTFAEFDSVYFPNGVSPKDSNNHAFCQVKLRECAIITGGGGLGNQRGGIGENHNYREGGWV